MTEPAVFFLSGLGRDWMKKRMKCGEREQGFKDKPLRYFILGHIIP
jgi:hypothetical protein